MVNTDSIVSVVLKKMCLIGVHIGDGWFKLERFGATLSVVGCWVLFSCIHQCVSYGL
jgi:hypothetical protein